MKDSTKILFSKLSMFHKLQMQAVTEWEKEEKDNYHALELVDSSYALREAIKLAEDSLKRLRKMEVMSHAKCGILCMNAGAVGDTLRTPYCTATVKVKQIPDLPKLHKDPERYTEFMEFMGIPADLIQHDMLRVNWKPFVAWMNKRTAEGYPFPKGLDISKVVTTAELQIRKKRDIEFIRPDSISGDSS